MKVSLEKPGFPQELVHFGVKGMKWGVRKQDDTSDRKTAKPISARREKKAKAKDAEAAATQSEIDRIRAKGKSVIPGLSGFRNYQVNNLSTVRDQKLKDAADIREGKLTDGQKKALIGAGIAAAVLIAYGSYKYVDSGKLNQRKTKDIPFKKNDLLTRKMGPDRLMKEVVAPINPDYGAPGTKMNCRRATMAYEMRRRGYDVQATLSRSATGQNPSSVIAVTDPTVGPKGLPYHRVLKRMIEDGSPDTPFKALKDANYLGKTSVDVRSNPASAIFNKLKMHPEGARGELAVEWKTGGAHSMAWEIIGGKPTIFDAQSGSAFDLPGFSSEKGSAISKAGITRLDNIDLNTEFLKRWVKNAV